MRKNFPGITGLPPFAGYSIRGGDMIRRSLQSIGANQQVIALSMSRLGDAIGNSILFIVIPLYVVRFESSLFPFPATVKAGLLISLYGLVNAACQPLAGALSDQINRRKPFIVGGMLLMALSILGFAFAGHFWELLFCRALQGAGLAFVLPATMALMASITEKRKRGGAMGVYTTSRMAGFALGPLIGGFLHVHYGYGAVFLSGIIFVTLGAFLVQLRVKENTPPRNTGSRRAFRLVDPKLLHHGIFALAAATFSMACAFSGVITLEKEFNERLHLTALGFGIAFSALMVSRLLFQIPFGRLSDAIGRRPLIISGLFAMVPATILLGETSSEAGLVSLRILQGIASAAIASPAFAMAADLAIAGGEGRQMSIITMGFTFGIAVGPMLSGILAVSFFELPFLVMGGLLVLAAAVVYRYVPETVHRHPA